VRWKVVIGGWWRKREEAVGLWKGGVDVLDIEVPKRSALGGVHSLMKQAHGKP
jgi:hypothetical protein